MSSPTKAHCLTCINDPFEGVCPKLGAAAFRLGIYASNPILATKTFPAMYPDCFERKGDQWYEPGVFILRPNLRSSPAQ